MAAPSTMMAGGPDPRLDDITAYIRPQHRKIHDPHVKFEEYLHYARKTRAEEASAPAPVTIRDKNIFKVLFPSKSDGGVSQLPIEKEWEEGGSSPANEKEAELHHDHKLNFAKNDDRMLVTDEEWTNASRALRTASWGAVFYLITTDILGPFGLPFAFASLGFGPGIALFTVYAGLAMYSGYLLWKIFLDMDSYEFPLKSYGDMGFRLFGWPLRYLMNLMQAVQLLLNVGLICVSNGEALSQAAKFKFCFAGCVAVWAGAGFVIGQVRTLQKFGWLANAAVWLNVACMIATMIGGSINPPNYAALSASAGAGLNNGTSITQVNGVYPPVQTVGGLPDPSSFIGSLNGAMSAVFAYGGAMIFPEFMSEMKRPMDFYKAQFGAQMFIYLVYMFYGLFLYGYQGQYVVNPSYLGISGYGVQLVGNIFAMLSSLIAAALYGNIGVKVLYNNIFFEWFNAPSLQTRAGKICWMGLIPIYWAIAFVVGAGIPNFVALTSIVAAFAILHFTYTFPPLLYTFYKMKLASMQAGEGFDPATGEVIRHDGGPRRWIRGFFASAWYLNVFNIIYFLGALALAGLGAYAAIENFKAGFASGATNSYVCKSPVDF